MRTRVHELHPALVHAPLALLPAAAIVDLAAAVGGDRRTDRLGRTLWWAAATSGLVAGLAGMAASQQVKARDPRAEGMMWLHGTANVGLVLGALALAAWRTRHRARVGVASVGLGAALASMYTAWLGGQLVYSFGVGVKPMPDYMDGGVRNSPPLASGDGARALPRDAARGLAWLLGRTGRTVAGKERVTAEAAGLGSGG